MLPDQPDIFIIGSGAIGKALAVFLKMAGRKVILLRGSIDDGSVQTQHILVETENGSISEADIEVATLSSFGILDGIVVLTIKSYGNEYLASILKAKTGSSPIVLLQNGLGVEKPFMNSDFPEVYRCVLFVTSQAIEKTYIRFKPVATCPIGIEKGNEKTLNYIVQQIQTPHFKFKNESNIQQIIWKKAIVNCVFNSVCPLLETDNGIFYRNNDALIFARRIILECIEITSAKGIWINPDEVEASLLQISRSSDGQFISTLQDIRNNRRTEIETLNLEIARIAENINKGGAVRETKLLGELTKLKADLNMLSTE